MIISIIDKAINETKEFFINHPNKVHQKFFLEAGEVYDLNGDIDSLEDQNAQLLTEIQKISKDIKSLIDQQNLQSDLPLWLKEVINNNYKLGVYWTEVTYFSFNNI